MTRGGQNVPLTLLAQDNNPNGTFGDFTIVWEPQGIVNQSGMADTAYQVTVNNVVVDGVPRTFTYTVTVIDPVTAPVATLTPTSTSIPPPTPSPAATVPTGGTPGGSEYRIGETANGSIQHNWNGGAAQQGYTLLRLDMVSGALVSLPIGGVITAGQTSLTDTFATPGGIYCHLLMNPAAQKNSNILCALRNTRSQIGAPENVTLKLSPANVATLNWSQPVGGGQAGYNVHIILGNAVAPPPSGPSGTEASVAISGLTCFQVEAINRGRSDILCAIPVGSTL
jgi:hypothetical protein